jgi:predicted kinase
MVDLGSIDAGRSDAPEGQAPIDHHGSSDYRQRRSTGPDLPRRLEALPEGHPSGPLDSGGTSISPASDRLREPHDGNAHDQIGNREYSTDKPTGPNQNLVDRASSESKNESSADAFWRRTDAEWAEHVEEVRDDLGKAQADGRSTDKQHTLDPAGEIWSDERDLCHDSILDHLYAAAADVPCDYRAIIAGGLPGAGKTTVLERYAGIDRSRYLTINPDDIKEELARRDLIPDVAGCSPMEASDLAHEESSYLARQLASRAKADGKNVIWDITMSSRTSTEQRIDDLRSAGYATIEAIFVDIPIDVSARRADARHREGEDNYQIGHGLGGRYVPPEVIESQADAELGSKNRRTFEEVKPKCNDWRCYDNGVDGRPPLLVDSSPSDRQGESAP